MSVYKNGINVTSRRECVEEGISYASRMECVEGINYVCRIECVGVGDSYR